MKESWEPLERLRFSLKVGQILVPRPEKAHLYVPGYKYTVTQEDELYNATPGDNFIILPHPANA